MTAFAIIEYMEIEQATEKIEQGAIKFAKARKLAVVSTVSPEGIPESAMVLYYMDEKFNLFFITRGDSRKMRNLATNKNIAVVIGTDLGPATLQMSGTAEIVSRDEQKNFIEKLSQDTTLGALYYGPFLEIVGINFTLYKVTMNWVRWLTLDLSRLKEVYYQIVPKDRA